MNLFNLVIRYQLRGGYIIYPLTTFTIDFLIQNLQSQIPTTTLLIVFLFIKKFIDPINSLEINSETVSITGVDIRRLLYIHNVTYFLWFGSGIALSSILLSLLSEFSGVESTLISLVILLTGLLSGNIAYQLFSNKPSQGNLIRKLFFIGLVTILSFVSLVLWYMNMIYHLMGLMTILIVILFIQIKNTKHYLHD